MLLAHHLDGFLCAFEVKLVILIFLWGLRRVQLLESRLRGEALAREGSLKPFVLDAGEVELSVLGLLSVH